jgi:hypothetical protein
MSRPVAWSGVFRWPTWPGVAPEHGRLVLVPVGQGQRDYPGLYWSTSRPRRTAPAQPPAFLISRSRVSRRTRSRFARYCAVTVH